jgi:hypothetical protein
MARYLPSDRFAGIGGRSNPVIHSDLGGLITKERIADPGSDGMTFTLQMNRRLDGLR